jgi:prepilin-type N-terminal cleavage/methylation domain-containing protein
VPLRRGFTLIELLVVISIILLLTIIAIPLIAPVLKGRDIREGARAVNVFLGSARNRALSSGRPVGVRIERFVSQNDVCMNLSYVEEPPPYAGDTLTSTALATIVRPNPNGPFLNIVGPSPFSGDDWTHVVRDGDRIKFNFQGHTFQLSRQGNLWVIGISFDLNNNNLPDDPWQMNSATWFQPVLATGAGLPYQVFRQPEKSAGDPLELAGGTAIDLNFSGDSGATMAPATASDATPIIIMFGADGSIERVYRSSASGQLVGTRPSSPLYLLIGRRENLMRGDDSGFGVFGVDDDGNGSTDDSAELGWPGSDDAPNLFDLEAIWVTVNHQSGLVASAANVWQPGGSLISARALAREAQQMGGR